MLHCLTAKKQHYSVSRLELLDLPTCKCIEAQDSIQAFQQHDNMPVLQTE